MPQQDNFRFVRSHVEETAFAALLPISGWIADYMEYTKLQESPGSFHFWTAASIISAVLGRRAWIDKGAYYVYPNIFVALIAPTGKCRKSTCMNMGTSLLQGSQWVNIIADKTTPEGLLESLMYGTENVGTGKKNRVARFDCCGFIKASELSVFLNKATYNQDMITILTSLFDCLDDFSYVTKTKKAIRLTNIAVSFLGASTPDWLASALPADAFGGGFMSRFVFVVKDETDRKITMTEYKMSEKAQALRNKLPHIYSTTQGRIRLTPEAHDWYVDWYHTKSNEVVDENLTGFMERKQDLILKLSIILAASHYAQVVDYTTIRQAYDIINWTQDRAFSAFKYVGMTRLGDLYHRILAFITARGGALPRWEVTRRFSRQLPNGIKDIDVIEQMMRETGEVTIDHVSTGIRPGKSYTIVKGE